jgi:hypothetical protein
MIVYYLHIVTTLYWVTVGRKELLQTFETSPRLRIL